MHTHHCARTTVDVQIGEDNLQSLKLFKALGFEQCNYVAAFQEIELQYTINDAATERLKAGAQDMRVIPAPDRCSPDVLQVTAACTSSP
eukprot:2148-Heterococcus_DN1.PRE.3